MKSKFHVELQDVPEIQIPKKNEEDENADAEDCDVEWENKSKPVE